MQERIFEYIKNKKGQRIGMLVGMVCNSQIVFGFSQVNLKSGDKFDRNIGMTMAVNRALGVQDSPTYTTEVYPMLAPFANRCVKYFQQATSLSLVGGYTGI